MNQDPLSLELGSSNISDEATAKRSVVVLRRLMVDVLSKATEGHFLLKEHGRVIAEVGDKSSEPHAEVDVLDTRCYAKALLGGDAAAGEAFVEGWWSTPDLTEVTRFFSRNLDMLDHWSTRFGWLLSPIRWARLLTRRNTRRQAKRNIIAHYDIGNDLYQSFLDPRMQYSSAIYNFDGEDLASAQANKLTRLCEQLKLNKNDHLLEIGSGWGGLALFAAKHFGCRVTTTTISDEQHDYAKELFRQHGVDDRITLLNQDYRSLQGQFDKIVSVEMIEAVGEKYLPIFFDKVNSLLRPGGLFMLQAITIADQRMHSYARSEDFIQKHIFPGGFLPSLALLARQIEKKTDLVIRDVLDIGLDYANTLADWREAFLSKSNELAVMGYDQRFRNLWLYYLGYCEGGFLERRISAVQLLASKAPHY